AYFPSGADVANNWTPPGMMGENSSLKVYPLDDELSRAYLASAGLRKGFHTVLFYPAIPRPYLPDPQSVAKAVSVPRRPGGMDVKLRSYAWGISLAETHNGEQAMVLAGWSPDNGDPDDFMYSLLDRDSARRPNALNYSFWRDDASHQLMLQGQATSD